MKNVLHSHITCVRNTFSNILPDFWGRKVILKQNTFLEIQNEKNN